MYAELLDLPMLRDVAEPVEGGGFEGRVGGEAGGAGGGGRQAAGDGAGDERGALLLQPLDQLPLLRHQPVHPPRLPVQKRRDGTLLGGVVGHGIQNL